MTALRVALLVLFGLMLTSPGYAEVDCTSLAFTAHLDDPDFACQEVDKTNLPDFGGITVRTLIAHGDLTGNIAHAAVTEKAEAALSAIAALPSGVPLKIDNVTIVLLGSQAANPADGPEPVYGIATKFEGDCILRLYPSRIVGNGKSIADNLSFTVAHELFHCVQYATWPALMTNFNDHPWVVEGTAELVAQAVFPNIPQALKEGFKFSDMFRDKPLTQLTYSNVVFFSWVWEKSPALMFKILSAIPEVGDEAAQQNALMTVISAADLSQFVRDFLDGKVNTPLDVGTGSGGYTLTMQTNVGLVHFDHSESRNLVSQPFAMFALDAEFSGGKYDVSFENMGPIDWQHRQMMPSSVNSDDLQVKGDWANGPLATQSDCAENDTYRLAGMATGDAKLRVTAETHEQATADCKSCGATAARDQCLVGTWMIDNTRMGLSISQYLSGDHAVGTIVGGQNAIKFDEAGHSVWGYQNFKIGVTDGVAGAPSASAIISGVIDQGWSASKGRLNTCFTSANAKMQIQIAGMAGQIIDFNEMPKVDIERYSYTCQDDDTLLIEKNLDGTPFLMRLHKLD